MSNLVVYWGYLIAIVIVIRIVELRVALCVAEIGEPHTGRAVNGRRSTVARARDYETALLLRPDSSSG